MDVLNLVCSVPKRKRTGEKEDTETWLTGSAFPFSMRMLVCWVDLDIRSSCTKIYSLCSIRGDVNKKDRAKEFCPGLSQTLSYVPLGE